MKKLEKTIVHTAVVALWLSPCVLGQEPTAMDKDAVRTQDASTPDYCSVSKLIGAKVAMAPGADAQREAAEEGEAAKRPKGKIDDAIADAHSGEIEFAIVQFGGWAGIGDKTVAVPMSELRWNPAQERFELNVTEDRLKALPTFDLDNARKTGLDTAIASVKTHWNKSATIPAEADRKVREAKEASATKEVKQLEGTTYYLVPARFVCVTEIDDFPVYATNEKFGKVNDLLLDRNKREIALAVVKRGGTLGIGGTEYLLPYRALKFCTSGEERLHCVLADTARLETAVVYEKPKHGVVDNDAARRALDSKTFDSKYRDDDNEKR
jgi:hypothetical protein